MSIYIASSVGSTFDSATARACSGVCLPICPKAQAAAALIWSSCSSTRQAHSDGIPCSINQKHNLYKSVPGKDNLKLVQIVRKCFSIYILLLQQAIGEHMLVVSYFYNIKTSKNFE